MEKCFNVVFDKVVEVKLQKAITKSNYREIIKGWLDALDEKGPKAGKLLDNHVWLYEMKNKHPPLRLYFYHQKEAKKIIIFEVEMKTSKKKQKETISKLRHRITRFLNLFVYILFLLSYLSNQEVSYKASYYEGFLPHS